MCGRWKGFHLIRKLLLVSYDHLLNRRNKEMFVNPIVVRQQFRHLLMHIHYIAVPLLLVVNVANRHFVIACNNIGTVNCQ